MITCHPTRGLDPGAAATVADRLLDAAAGGAAVVWMGAELEEVLAVAHRVVVLSRRSVTGEFDRPFDRSAIGLAMGGHAMTHAWPSRSTRPSRSARRSTPGGDALAADGAGLPACRSPPCSSPWPIGAVLIAREGENPFAVYADVVRGVFVAKRGLQQHGGRRRRR